MYSKKDKIKKVYTYEEEEMNEILACLHELITYLPAPACRMKTLAVALQKMLMEGSSK